MYMDLTLGGAVLQVEATEEEEEEEQALGQETASAVVVVGGGGGGGGDGGGGGVLEREHMFDKVVTPSDVGKLNRLVVPKQHAERFFPAAAAGTTQLCFEDRAGTPWRFRYSYWGSSQSYVITKGWSRFVRAARLSAGDTVSFFRAGDRYFIDYRHCHHRHGRDISFAAAAAAAAMPAWPPLFGLVQTAPASYGPGSATVFLDTVAPVVAGHRVEVGPTGKRSFRLFGVNVECGGGVEAAAVAAEEDADDDDDDDDDDDGDR
ncbi:hypothetical protein E2562_034388 [Oryza meyeriana var. granulata]|uniref:TF-B3 domain-containing protein n=1 Tax=Oryza meyeriana var. granulata TaxID=110450 RepID=A0A6G1CKJ4_9ORYZ|nr:hypothetical protein E2562_034388 [Oryza meyeriana var. granulata]